MTELTTSVGLQETIFSARTALYPLHIEHSARMVTFAGWEMPLQFSGITNEHQAVRQAAGMFDISHMGKFALSGQDVIGELQKLVPSDLGRLQPGQSQYTTLLNAQAGIIDDVIIYYQGYTPAGEQRVLMIVNAATTAKDRNWIAVNLEDCEVYLQDLSTEQVLLAVQGPEAIALLAPLVAGNLAATPRFGHFQGTILDQPAFFARTGYTGEDGYEIMVDLEVGAELWQALLKAGITPCGLGARDTLRLEAALALYGQDIDETTTPLEAGLGWLVHLDTKGYFVGRKVLERQKNAGVPRRLVGLKMQGRNIARHDYPVLHEGQPVGNITSGTLSPTLGYPIALAYVPIALSQLGQLLEVEIRGKAYSAEVVKKPFYKRQAF